MLKSIRIDSLVWFFKAILSISLIPYLLSYAVASKEMTSLAPILKKKYKVDYIGKARGIAGDILHEATAMHELALQTLRHGRVNKPRAHAGLAQKKLRKRNE